MARGAKPTLVVSADAMARSFDQDRDRPSHAGRTRSLWKTWWCANAYCDGFTDRGSYDLKRCTRCGTARPSDA